jgi:hypothetical protein
LTRPSRRVRIARLEPNRAPASESRPHDRQAGSFRVGPGRHPGNFPQAFSHLTLIEAAARIILGKRLRALTR